MDTIKSTKLELWYPLNPFKINQEFGDSLACTEDNNLPITKRKVVGMIAPIGTNNYVCPVGYVELYPLLGMKGHTGMDLRAYHGQELYHCGPEGIVEEVATEIERGLGLGIITNDKFDFEGGTYNAKIRYWHLKGFSVNKGDIVKRGDLIGYCDNTGLSAGDHLHMELKPVLKNSKGVWYNVFQNNGYFGSVDQKPYFNGKFAKDIDTGRIEFKTSLKFGSRGDEVVKLQEALRKLGYFTHPTNTGNYYGKTQEAVLAFQLEMGVVKFGIESLFGFYFGEKSRKALTELINK